MTGKSIKRLIDLLNKGTITELINIVPLSENVMWGKVWESWPKPGGEIGSRPLPLTFYFIKNQNSHYVGAVLDMFNDLHWYVLPAYRKCGHLTVALEGIILPHLVQDSDRTTLNISIDCDQIGSKNFSASERVALKVGFTKLSASSGRCEYQLQTDRYIGDKWQSIDAPGISEDRLKELRKKLYFISHSLAILQTEIEINLGDPDYTEELRKITNNVYRQIWELEDSWLDLQ